ncbi:ABC transporter ATP-binding protein [Vibrio gangliei]|uniref:ABC transporter ATP-binding protein n=1 Tax=Vibrio gangliei TaxID=2077090 RepID=UPI000D0214BA|nr:ATP-binding cassette domain-containing protein [Vibrio gangliei]
MFRLQDVTFETQNKTILSPTSLSFEKGKVTSLLGHNGSGKSTLIKMLARQQAATQGEIELDEKNIHLLTAKEFALKVAYLPQHPPLTDGVKVRELVRFGRYPWKGLFGRYSSKDEEYIDEAIEQVGLAHMQDRFVATLSGGERQRAWMAMLLAQKSECILLDEPTSALDVAHQYELLALVRELNQALGLTVIMVLHDINMAARFSDQMVALHSGKVLASGTPEELMQQDVLHQIYGIPLDLFVHPETGHAISYIR